MFDHSNLVLAAQSRRISAMTRRTDDAEGRLATLEQQMHTSLSSSADQLSGEIGQVRQLAAEMQEAEQKKRAEQMARRWRGLPNFFLA